MISLLREDVRYTARTLKRSPRAALFSLLLSKGFYVLCIIRLACMLHKIKLIKFLCHPLQVLAGALGTTFTPQTRFGPGLFVPHSTGIVIGAYEIKGNVTVMQNSTTGAIVLDGGFDANIRPHIGRNVVLGVGSVVLGNVTLENKTVKPNEVILAQ